MFEFVKNSLLCVRLFSLPLKYIFTKLGNCYKPNICASLTRSYIRNTPYSYNNSIEKYYCRLSPFDFTLFGQPVSLVLLDNIYV